MVPGFLGRGVVGIQKFIPRCCRSFDRLTAEGHQKDRASERRHGEV